jgi:TIR domain
MIGSPQTSKAIEVFYSYAHEDEGLKEKLRTHLAGLRRRGLITEWHDRLIGAGCEWKNVIDARLESARVILLLVSSDFVHSDYCYGIEMEVALERHEKGDARAIPIIMRPVVWKELPFAKLNALPTNGVPVVTWSNLDEGLADVAVGIERAVKELIPQLFPKDEPIKAPPFPAPGVEQVEYRIILNLRFSESELALIKVMLEHLRKLAKDPHLVLAQIGEGSVILIIRGSVEGFLRLRLMVHLRQLTHLMGVEIIGVHWIRSLDRDSRRGAAHVKEVREVAGEFIEDASSVGLQTAAHAAEDKKDFERARQIYQYGITLSVLSGDRFSTIVFTNGLGITETKAGNFDEARRCFQVALEMFKETGDSGSAEVILANMEMVRDMQARAKGDKAASSDTEYTA